MLWLDVPTGASVLDYCAGGGGKSLALADLYDAKMCAHDVSFDRMKDIPARAARANVDIATIAPHAIGDDQKFDVVLVDAPCSGSGTWRRNPEAKWAFSAARLDEFQALQRQILHKASRYVAPNGILVYATCSVLTQENASQSNWFLDQQPNFILERSMQLVPTNLHDGFYCAVFKH
jgi:16S rRNA (cytosine967-C5)-methyltransferase